MFNIALCAWNVPDCTYTQIAKATKQCLTEKSLRFFMINTGSVSLEYLFFYINKAAFCCVELCAVHFKPSSISLLVSRPLTVLLVLLFIGGSTLTSLESRQSNSCWPGESTAVSWPGPARAIQGISPCQSGQHLDPFNLHHYSSATRLQDCNGPMCNALTIRQVVVREVAALFESGGKFTIQEEKPQSSQDLLAGHQVM